MFVLTGGGNSTPPHPPSSTSRFWAGQQHLKNVEPSPSRTLEVMSGAWVKYLAKVNTVGGG